MLIVEDDPQHGGVDLGVASHIRHHIRQLPHGVSPGEGGGVAHDAAGVILFHEIIGDLRHRLLVLVGVEEHDLVLQRKHVRHGVVLEQGVAEGSPGLQDIASRKEQKKQHGHGTEEAARKPGQSVHIGIKEFLVVFEDGIRGGEDQRGKEGADADHAQKHALGQHHAQIPADAETHEDQHDHAHHGGHAGGEDGGHGLGQCRFHGGHAVRLILQLLPVPVHEDDGIVHGQDHLQQGRDGEGDVRDLPLNEVRPHVDEHGDADGGGKEHRLEPGAAHGEEDDHETGHGESHHAGRQDALAHVGVLPHHLIPVKAPVDGLFDGDLLLGGVGIIRVHHKEGVIVLVVIGIARFVIHVFHIGDVGKLLPDDRDLLLPEMREHDADIGFLGKIREFLRHLVHADLHGGVWRQVFCHVVVDLHERKQHRAADGEDRHDDDEDPAVIHDPVGSLLQHKRSPLRF